VEFQRCWILKSKQIFGQKWTYLKEIIALCEIGHDFKDKECEKLKLSKYGFNKKCAPKLSFLIEKKNLRNLEDS